jgi:hypothetical protein
MHAIFEKKVEFSDIEIKNFRIRLSKISVLTGSRTAEDLKIDIFKFHLIDNDYTVENKLKLNIDKSTLLT